MGWNGQNRATELRSSDAAHEPMGTPAESSPEASLAVTPTERRWVEDVDFASSSEDLTVAVEHDGPDRPDGPDLPQAARRRWRVTQMRTVWAQANSSRLTLTENGVRIASATRYLLSGVLNGQPIRICAIGDLTCRPETTPAAMSQLFEDIEADACTRHGASVILLFCNDLHRWHNEGRYQEITPLEIRLAFQPTRRPGAPMLSIRSGEDRDLPAMIAMDETRAAPFLFHLNRGVDFVKHGIVRERLLAGLGPAGKQELQFFVTEEGTVATAFVVLRVRAGIWTILQCGDRDPTGARVGAILQALIARDPSQPPPIVHGWLPPGFTPPQAIRVSATPSSQMLWARVLSDQLPESTLRAESSLYWLSDRF